MIDTTNWVKYPVYFNGMKFVSLINPAGSFYPEIKELPEGVLQEFHNSMIADLIGDPAELSPSELEAKLLEINDGATQAILALA
jgi:hypothetical protein